MKYEREGVIRPWKPQHIPNRLGGTDPLEASLCLHALFPLPPTPPSLFKIHRAFPHLMTLSHTHPLLHPFTQGLNVTTTLHKHPELAWKSSHKVPLLLRSVRFLLAQGRRRFPTPSSRFMKGDSRFSLFPLVLCGFKKLIMVFFFTGDCDQKDGYVSNGMKLSVVLLLLSLSNNWIHLLSTHYL